MVNDELCFKTKEVEEYYNHLDSLKDGYFKEVFTSEWIKLTSSLKERKPNKTMLMRNSSSSVVFSKVV